jgi:D-arabinose 1-dehydrogenase-like Zn-dependent alcohol dehydrogenase
VSNVSVGHLAVQYSNVFGMTTVAVDVEDKKLQMAKDLGADHVVDGRSDRLQQELAQLGGIDVALVTVPSPAAMQAAHAALNRMAVWFWSVCPPTTGSSYRCSRRSSRASRSSGHW